MRNEQEEKEKKYKLNKSELEINRGIELLLRNGRKNKTEEKKIIEIKVDKVFKIFKKINLSFYFSIS